MFHHTTSHSSTPVCSKQRRLLRCFAPGQLWIRGGSRQFLRPLGVRDLQWAEEEGRSAVDGRWSVLGAGGNGATVSQLFLEVLESFGFGCNWMMDQRNWEANWKTSEWTTLRRGAECPCSPGGLWSSKASTATSTLPRTGSGRQHWLGKRPQNMV